MNSWGAIMSRNPGDAIGSLTSHVVWTKPIQSGGVVGGNAFYDGGAYPGNGQGVGYYEGTAYEQRYVNPIIMDGILYYMAPLGFDAPSYGPLTALNLATVTSCLDQQYITSTIIRLHIKPLESRRTRNLPTNPNLPERSFMGNG